jgi:hypothetical protein
MMARIDFQYNYRIVDSKYRYYPGGTPQGAYDAGLAAMLINHLNLSRRDLILKMSNLRRKSESSVRKRSRVDTGAMKRQVTGTGDFGTDILKISFGWEPFAPYYAPFQEFGTRNGITPMMAVGSTYLEAVEELKRMVQG